MRDFEQNNWQKALRRAHHRVEGQPRVLGSLQPVICMYVCMYICMYAYVEGQPRVLGSLQPVICMYVCIYVCMRT
jgi:hypothetical protein